jgi:hypothetical protein
MLREIVVTQSAERGLHALVTGSTTSAGRWICQQQSLSRQMPSFSSQILI